MFKLVAIDLDGTLLNSYSEVTKRTKDVLNEAIKKNIEIVLASGRTISSVESIAKELNADNYLISGNGSIVYDIKNKEIIYNKFMNKEQILNIAKICDENSIYYNIYTEESVITKNLSYNALFYHKENVNKPENKRTSINIVEDVYKYIKNSDVNEYLKVTICDETKVVFNSIIRKIKQIPNIDVLDVSHMSRKLIKSGTEDVLVEYFYTEITNKDVDKWNAIEFLINKLGIKKEEVVAIGDNSNDKKMIENAGLGVAMGNGAEYVKDIANVVVSDNNSDGVAEAFEKYIL